MSRPKLKVLFEGKLTESKRNVRIVRAACGYGARRERLQTLWASTTLRWAGWPAGMIHETRPDPASRDHVVPMLIPKEGVRYQEQYSERFVEIRRETVNFIKTVIAR